MKAACTFCGQAAPFFLRARDYNRRTTNEWFSYYRCAGCGLVFLDPKPISMHRYYPQDYYTIPAKLDDSTPGVADELFKLRLLERLMPSGGRLLEVGPAWGMFLFLAKRAGFTAEAIEMDAHCCAFLRDEIGIDTIQSDDPTLTLRSGDKVYDVITLWHVIEHLADPWAFISAASKHLTPGGVLILAAPNPTGLQFNLFGRYWTHLDAPRHLQIIPPRLLLRRGEELGLETAMCLGNDEGSLHWNNFGWQWSVVNMVPYARGSSYVDGKLRGLVRRVGMVTARAVAGIESSGDGLRGSAYTVALRKTKGSMSSAVEGTHFSP